MNIEPTLQAKSDQLNADDLIAAPLTITITDVTKGSAEQPVNIHWQGGDGRPYKPSKSMRRVIAQAWGVDSKAYIGRSMTLYREPTVRYAGAEIGGIRISHISHISSPMKTALTIARGKREPYIVEPLTVRDIKAEGDQAAAQGMDALKAWWGKLPADARATWKDTLDKVWKPAAEKGGDA